MASPSGSTLTSYRAPGANGSVVVGPGGFKAKDGCTLRTIIDLAGSSGLVKAYRSVMSNRASPRGNPKLGPEAWCDIGTLFLETPSARVDRRNILIGLPHHPAREIPAPSTC